MSAPSFDLDKIVTALDAAIDEQFERSQVPWLKALVEQPSHTYAAADVEAAAALVDAKAAELGLQRTLFADPEGRFASHRVYSTPATGARDRSLALVGHVDTVFPRSMGFLSFAREDGPGGPQTGDVIRGPGVLDMKSGLSAVLFALAAVRQVLGSDYGGLRVRFLCNTDEEIGSPSSGPMFDALAPLLDEALVFESGRESDRIVVERKGSGFFEVHAHGKAAHAGNDHAAGVSAIHALALVIPRIEALTDYSRDVTVNVGIVQGGTAKNTVPEHASCFIDARFSTVADAKALSAALQALVERPFDGCGNVPEKLSAVRFELKSVVSRPPMEASDASHSLRRRYETCAARYGLGTGAAPRQGGGSDANLLAAAGVPCIDGLGPYGKFFHSTNEWSSLRSLASRTKALAAFLVDGLAQRLDR